MPVAHHAFQTPSIMAPSGSVPSFLSCSTTILSNRATPDTARRAMLAKTKGAILDPQPFLRGQKVPASKLVLNYSTGQVRPAGTCIERSATKLSRPPRLACNASQRAQFPTSSEKSVLPCDSDSLNSLTATVPVVPESNQSDLIVKPFPNNNLASSVISMGRKPATPYTPDFFGRVLTQSDVSFMSVTPTD
mgnify:CR=1 FL=1